MSNNTPTEKQIQDVLERIERLENLVAQLKKDLIIEEAIKESKK